MDRRDTDCPTHGKPASGRDALGCTALDRRTFIQLSGVTLAGLALVSCSSGGATTDADGTTADTTAPSEVEVTDTPATADAPEQEDTWEPPTLIACAGDSITWGYGVQDTRDTDSYPAQLKALLAEGGAPTQVENYGLNGACALSSGKNPYIDFAEYWDSLDSGADLVVLMLGTNDAASALWDQATYEAELTERVQAYQATEATATGESPQVVLMVPPDIFSTDWAGGVPEATVDEMQQAVHKVAENLGLTCVDLEPVFAGRSDLFPDGVHPNAEGNALIAHAVYDALT